MLDAADRIEALEAENARLRAALHEIAGYPCTCEPAFYERGLVAPDCLADLCSDDARMALGAPPQCQGRAARKGRRD
jgi:hypothetical protein